METSQGEGGARAFLLMFALVVFFLVSFQAGKEALAAHRSHSSRPQDWLRAAELEPGNAEYWDHLGEYREYDFDNANLSLAVSYFKEALARNPLSDRYWLHLASAYELQGEPNLARDAYRNARSVYPISANVTWNYGNFLLRQSQFAEGFAEIHRAVTTDPSLIPLAISRCWRSNPDVDSLLGDVLPASPDAYFQALDYLSSSHELSAALKTWDRLMRLNRPLPLQRSLPFFDELIRQENAEDTRRIWRQALEAAQWPVAVPADGSLIWNGGFEAETADGGLDWRLQPIIGASAERDSATYHSGRYSLRLDFDGGANLDFSNLSEYVPVEPHTAYHFSAYLRTEQITTESGFFLLITDPLHNEKPQFRTDELTGTHPWSLLETSVVTGAESHFVLVQLRRLPSRLFDNKLAGTVWLDDVSLIPVPVQSHQVEQ